jgi:hypothetical protein
MPGERHRSRQRLIDALMGPEAGRVVSKGGWKDRSVTALGRPCRGTQIKGAYIDRSLAPSAILTLRGPLKTTIVPFMLDLYFDISLTRAARGARETGVAMRGPWKPGKAAVRLPNLDSLIAFLGNRLIIWVDRMITKLLVKMNRRKR